MSIKSRNRTDKNRDKKSTSNLLNLQKQAIKTDTLNNLACSILFFMFAIIGMIIVVLNGEASLKISGIIFAELIIGITSIYYFGCFFQRFIIFRQLREIQFSSEQSVSVYCRKVSFLLQPGSKFSSFVLCIVIVDEGGNKFYYVYPTKNSPSDFSRKYIKDQYIGKRLELKCYKNTNVVKALPMQ